MLNRWWWLPVSLMLSITVVAQQSTCAQLIRNTFDTIAESCTPQADGTMCHGHPTLHVTVNATLDDIPDFSSAGDVLPITAIDSFITSIEDGTWGTTRLDIQTYPATNMNPIDATMVVVGDVLVFNNGTEDILIPTVDLLVTERQGANARSAPNPDASLVTGLIFNTMFKASGRLADNTWVRLHPSQDEVAWVSTGVIAEDFTQLPIVDPDEELPSLILPFQSLDFQSGPRLGNCGNSGLSGILLQSYSDESPAVYTINGVEVAVNGTLFLQAQPENGMQVSVLDGTATVTALDETLMINEGYMSRILMELNDEGRLEAVEIPSVPLVYDYNVLLSLPLDLLSVETRLALDIYTVISPRPVSGESPIAGMALDAPCKFTVGQSGANIRSKPGTDGTIIAVMNYRESAEPIGRAIGTDGLPWWKLAEAIWVRVDATVTGGNCPAVPLVEYSE